MHVEKLIGWNLKRIREERQLTQAQLGLHLLAPDQSYLSQMEAGERNPTARILFRIAEGLGITVGDLFQTDGVPEEIANAPNKAVPKTRAGRVKKKPDTKRADKRSKASGSARTKTGRARVGT